MKKILIITYLFPPAGGVMVQRVLKFVKYLPHFGWRPTILTVRHPDHNLFDPQLLQDVHPEIEIIRTGTFEPTKIVKHIRSHVDRVRSVLSKPQSQRRRGGIDPLPRQSRATRISTFLSMPDNRAGWLPFALLAIMKELRNRRFDVILSSSPPFTVQLVGLLAKLVLKRPWMADLRDLWVLNPHTRPPTGIHLWVSRSIERKVFQLADKVITVSEPLSDDLRSAYRDIPAEKFLVIPNGYDPDDFKAEDVEPHEKFTLAHVGSLYLFSGRTPYFFLMALSDLRKEIPDLEKNMQVIFVGPMDRANGRMIDAMLPELGLSGMLRRVGPVSHREAIKYMKRSDALLFIIGRSLDGCPSSRGCVSGKLYEYFAAHKPVLALAQEGPVKELIEESRTGVFANYDDREQIKREILGLYRKFKEGRLKTPSDMGFMSRYNRKNLTEQLARILDGISE